MAHPTSPVQPLPSTAIVPVATTAALDEIVTRMTFATSPGETWAGLLFYEQIEEKPPWLLRQLLPVPIRTEGRKSEVGDEARCLYEGGYLLKRVTGIERERRYRFSVVEQALVVGGGLRLSDGEYTLTALPDGGTEVSVVTRYHSHHRPRWFWRPIEAAICHHFHRHILRSMRRAIEAR